MSHIGDEFLARSQYKGALHYGHERLNDQLFNYAAWLNGESSNFTLVHAIPIRHTVHQCVLRVA